MVSGTVRAGLGLSAATVPFATFALRDLRPLACCVVDMVRFRESSVSILLRRACGNETRKHCIFLQGHVVLGKESSHIAPELPIPLTLDGVNGRDSHMSLRGMDCSFDKSAIRDMEKVRIHLITYCPLGELLLVRAMT